MRYKDLIGKKVRLTKAFNGKVCGVFEGVVDMVEGCHISIIQSDGTGIMFPKPHRTNEKIEVIE